MSGIGVVVKSLHGREMKSSKEPRYKGLNKVKLVFVKLDRYFSKHPVLSKVFRIMLSIISISIIFSLIHFYNDFGRLATRAEAGYAQIGKEVRRRNNLVPNLISTIENYIFHERKVFEHVSDAREVFFNIREAVKSEKSSELNSVLSKLLALVEQYPNLKATESIQDLIKELVNTEDRIAEEKAKYNENARHFNQMLTVFPTNVLCKIYGYGRQYPYVSTDEDFLKVPYVTNFNR
jgi:LemA protein